MTQTTFQGFIHDRYFEDYRVGESYEFGPICIDKNDIIDFAEKYDPQVMHVDATKSEQGPYGGLIASGWHTVSMLMRLYVDHYLSAVGSLASPGVNELRWHRPVRPGDCLKLRVSVLNSQPSRSKADRGLVVSYLEGVNQNQEVVCTMQAMNLLMKRPG
ncbi:MAG: MaoC family dehydratase [Afipia sp.]|nr:MaoC family dehydratase [Afipia sp.]